MVVYSCGREPCSLASSLARVHFLVIKPDDKCFECEQGMQTLLTQGDVFVSEERFRTRQGNSSLLLVLKSGRHELGKSRQHFAYIIQDPR